MLFLPIHWRIVTGRFLSPSSRKRLNCPGPPHCRQVLSLYTYTELYPEPLPLPITPSSGSRRNPIRVDARKRGRTRRAHPQSGADASRAVPTRCDRCPASRTEKGGTASRKDEAPRLATPPWSKLHLRRRRRVRQLRPRRSRLKRAKWLLDLIRSFEHRTKGGYGVDAVHFVLGIYKYAETSAKRASGS